MKMFGLFKKKGKSKKILVVDDEPRIRETLESRLEMNEYCVLTAQNGSEGLDKAVNHMPDIILLDIMMPEMNGLEMLELLRKNPECDNIAVIMLTARNRKEDIERAESYGIDDYIVKPFDMFNLIRKIDNVFEARSAAVS
jgi:CheY-like chemotaxis protein